MHWHIDYLRAHADPIGVCLSYAPERLEHAWAHTLAGIRSMSVVPRFGSSDCACPSHLFFCGLKLRLAALLSAKYARETIIYHDLVAEPATLPAPGRSPD